MAIPAVKNGALIRLVRGDDVRFRAFDGPLPTGLTVEGISIVTLDSLLGGLPFEVINPGVGQTAIGSYRGSPAVLVGAVVKDAQNFVGTVESQHCAVMDLNCA